MGLEGIKRAIENLNQSAKLLLVENTWDIISSGNCDIPMYELQKKELDKRYSEYKEGKLDTHKWENVHNELREQYK
jgi:putative addiction module component (TIGR02574 family)